MVSLQPLPQTWPLMTKKQKWCLLKALKITVDSSTHPSQINAWLTHSFLTCEQFHPVSIHLLLLVSTYLASPPYVIMYPCFPQGPGELEPIILKFACNLRGSQISKVILIKKNKDSVIMLPDFKLYSKAIVIKTVWYWHKKRHTD